MSAHEWKWLEIWVLWENVMVQSPLKSSMVLFLQNKPMTRVYIHLALNSWGLCRPKVSNFTLIAKFVEVCKCMLSSFCSLNTISFHCKLVDVNCLLKTQERQHIWVDYSDKTEENTKNTEKLNSIITDNFSFFHSFRNKMLFFGPSILSLHADKNLFSFFTIQPSWIMLLCSDWMMISQGTENSKVPSHEISRCARVQLSICQWEKYG